MCLDAQSGPRIDGQGIGFAHRDAFRQIAEGPAGECGAFPLRGGAGPRGCFAEGRGLGLFELLTERIQIAPGAEGLAVMPYDLDA